MGASDHPNHPELARRIQADLRWRNTHPRHPDVRKDSAGNLPGSAPNVINAWADPERHGPGRPSWSPH